MVFLITELLLGTHKVVVFILFFTVIFYLLFGLLVAFDFLTLGFFKRIKNRFFSSFYLGIYKFYSFVTLSFLWRAMLFNFLDRPYTKRLLFLSVPYLLFLGFLGGFNAYSYGHYPDFIHQGHYNDLKTINENSFNLSFYEEERNRYADSDVFQKVIANFSIPSKKIAGPIGEIFVKARSGDKWLIAKIDSTIQPLREEGLTHHILGAKSDFEDGFNKGSREAEMDYFREKYENHPNWQQKRDSLLQTFETKDAIRLKQQFLKSKEILKNAIILKIDEQTIDPSKITCDFYTHPQGKLQGMLCFYPIDSLTIGRHYLTIGKVTGRKITVGKISIGSKNNLSNVIRLDTTYQKIPFIYTGQY